MNNSYCEVYLVRHGQTESNVVGRIQGHSDSSLTDLGKSQISALAHRLKEKRLNFKEIWCSELGRAQSSAEIFSQLLDLRVQIHPGLKEVSFGNVEGSTWEEVRNLHPELQQAWYEHRAEARLPGGESREEVLKRLQTTLEQWREQNPNSRLLAVTHGGVLACLMTWLMQIPAGIRPRCSIDNGALSIIQFKNNSWRIKTWNDSFHHDSSYRL